MVVPEESYGAALQYFTGSKEHGIALRKIAQSMELRLNEWGLFTSGSKEKMVFSNSIKKIVSPKKSAFKEGS